jgi:hypothetical protein
MGRKPHGEAMVGVVARGGEEPRMEGKPREEAVVGVVARLGVVTGGVQKQSAVLLIGGVVGGIGSIGFGDEMGQLRKRSIGRSGWSKSSSRSGSRSSSER